MKDQKLELTTIHYAKNIHYTFPVITGCNLSLQENTRRWPNVLLMFDHRLRRWPNIDTTLTRCLVLAGKKTLLFARIVSDDIHKYILLQPFLTLYSINTYCQRLVTTISKLMVTRLFVEIGFTKEVEV